MGKEIVTVTVEIDSDLMERLRATGMEPVEYLQRLTRRDAVLRETPEQRQARADAWREENREELESYDRFIAEHGLWCEDLRTF
jgi:post-segregation antitoxin (ccd killing protein)